MRQYISESFPDKKGLLTVSGKDFRYFRQVLRIKAGDMVSVRLPDGSLQKMTAAKIEENSKKIILQICADSKNEITRGVLSSEIQNNSTTEYVLFQIVPKPVKFEQIVRQATECGVSIIVPVIGEYSEKSAVDAISGNKSERLNKIIKEARQQSGSPVSTKIEKPLSVTEACEFWKNLCTTNDADTKNAAFILSERNDATGNIQRVLSEKKAAVKFAAIACGSEGGVSPDEVSLLQNEGGFIPVHFETNILRCETAALYGMAIVQALVSQANHDLEK